MQKIYCAVVSSTHWDREWYQPFQGYRYRLIKMIDDLLDILDREQEYRHFFFDGQTIVLEDYLEVRPEQRERLTRHIREGRIGIGPWYVMPDEFLVSGESLIRNFMKGIRIARSYGVGEVKCGYVSDIFGHNSQFPQILRGFNIDNAIMFRGFKDNTCPAEFRWESPDGSWVHGIKQDSERAYSDFYFAIRRPFEGREYEEEELVEHMGKLLAHKKAMQLSDVWLMVDGVDHMDAEPRVPELLKLFNRRFPDYKFVQVSMEEFLQRRREAKPSRSPNAEFPIIRGEIREPGFKGLNNAILANVLSSRVDIKQQNEACQILLERWVEPITIMAELRGMEIPPGYLNIAWEFLLQNHPHDSICGCSVSQVHKDMGYRFDQCRLIGEELLHKAMLHMRRDLDASFMTGDHIVILYNPTSISGSKVYVFELAFRKGTPIDNILLYTPDNRILPYQILSIREDTTREKEVLRTPGTLYHRTLIEIAAQVNIPAFGMTTLSYKAQGTRNPKRGEYLVEEPIQPVRYPGSLRTGSHSFENDFLIITVNPGGTLDITDKENNRTYSRILLMEDRGEIGDGWLYCRPFMDEVVVGGPSESIISIEADGLHLVRFTIRTCLKIPAAIGTDSYRRCHDRIDMPVTHTVTLFKDSRRIEVVTGIDNKAKDHVVKMLYPLCNSQEGKYYTDTPFDLVARDFETPDRSDYKETDTRCMPSQGFMWMGDSTGGLAVFTKGLYEWEPNPDAQNMALTLMRCFSKEFTTLGGKDGQLPGIRIFEHALFIKGLSETADILQEDIAANLYKEYIGYKTGIRSLWGLREMGCGKGELSKSLLELGSGAVAVSCMKRREDGSSFSNSYILRLFNPYTTDQPYDIRFAVPLIECWEVNLNEERISTGKLNGIIQAKGILTLELVTKQNRV